MQVKMCEVVIKRCNTAMRHTQGTSANGEAENNVQGNSAQSTQPPREEDRQQVEMTSQLSIIQMVNSGAQFHI